MQRPSLPPRLRCILAIMLVSTAAWIQAASARTFLLKPDGSGDVPTFQAGMDTLLSRMSRNADPTPDTLQVDAGVYAEDVTLHYTDYYSAGKAVVWCSGGPSLTRLRSFQQIDDTEHPRLRGSNVGPFDVTPNLSIIGLQIDQAISVSASISWAGCLFAGGFTGRATHSFSIRFDGCEFRGTVSIDTDSIQTCRFRTQHAELNNVSGLGRLYVIDCTFSGSDEVVVYPTDGYSCVFQYCTFDSMKVGLRCDYLGDGFLLVEHCRFKDISGLAVSSFYPGFGVDHFITLEDSRIERCGGVSFVNANRSGFYAARDTFADVAGDAIRVVTGGRVAFGDLLLTQGSGNGIVAVSMDPSFDFDFGPPRPQIEILRCTLTGFAGHGLVIRDSVPTDFRAFHRIDGCLFASNALGGILASTSRLELRTTLSRDNEGDGMMWVPNGLPDGPARLIAELCTFAANAGHGLSVDNQGSCRPYLDARRNLSVNNKSAGFNAPQPLNGFLEHNVAWNNASGAFIGASPKEVNLVADPRFCTEAAPYSRVATDSPCSPSGPFGLVGAVDVGCSTNTSANHGGRPAELSWHPTEKSRRSARPLRATGTDR